MTGKTSNTKTLWWEKTVEWQFVLSASVEPNLCAAPLDGHSEAAEGDARILSFGGLALLEFKREAGECHGVSEWKKYARGLKVAKNKDASAAYRRAFETAAEALSDEAVLPGSKAHMFLYGTALEEVTSGDCTRHRLLLEAAPYWKPEKPITGDSVIDAIMGRAASKTDFDKYVLELAWFRGYTEDTRSGGASVVSYQGGLVTVMDIVDYVRVAKKELQAAPAPGRNGMGGPKN